MFKIYLDVGHGGTEQSMETNGLKEKDVNLAVATKVREILILEGVIVMMSRTADTGTNTDENIINSANKCNAWGADYAYSIHHNGFNGEIVGYDLIYSDIKTPSLAMANAIGEQYNSADRPKHSISTHPYIDDNGGIQDWYGIMRRIDCPCIISEYCYMDTPSEAALVNTKAGTDAEALEIAKGILGFLKMPMPVVAPVAPVILPLPAIIPMPTITPLPPYVNYADQDKIADWALEAVKNMKQQKIMLGDTDNMFWPNDPITRQELAVALDRIMKF